MNDQLPRVSTVQMYFENLAVINGSVERLPLAMLGQYSCVHGGLRVVINDECLPGMGYWSADDVCFPAWVKALGAACSVLAGNVFGTYQFGEQDQGNSFYNFERDHESMFITIAADETSGGEADPDWQRIECRFEDFCRQYVDMRYAFVEEIRNLAPKAADAWLARRLPQT